MYFFSGGNIGTNTTKNRENEFIINFKESSKKEKCTDDSEEMKESPLKRRKNVDQESHEGKKLTDQFDVQKDEKDYDNRDCEENLSIFYEKETQRRSIEGNSQVSKEVKFLNESEPQVPASMFDDSDLMS